MGVFVSCDVTFDVDVTGVVGTKRDDMSDGNSTFGIAEEEEEEIFFSFSDS